MAPIGSITTTTFGPLLAPYITRRAFRALVHICFPVVRGICFIARTLTIQEHMEIATVETYGSVVKVLSSMMPTLSLSHISIIGSVQRMVVNICKVDDIENALESIA